MNRMIRYSSSKTGDHRLTYVPHAYPLSEAAKRITEFDQNRLFAPFPIKTTELVPSEKSPLTAVFVPVCAAHAKISSTHYKGAVGKYRYVTDYHWDDKGNMHTSTRRVTDWHDISGSMGAYQYTQAHPNLSIYFGELYDHRPIEKAISGYNLEGYLQAFDKNKIDKSIGIDPWAKTDGYGIDEANKRINQAEKSRAYEDIRNRCWDADEISVYHTSISFLKHSDGRQHFGLKAMMLPVYVLQYPNNPIRVLPAISEQKTDVIGSNPISSIKVTVATTAATTLLSLFFPQVAIPTRLGVIFCTAGLSAFSAHFKPSINHYSEQRSINNQKEASESFARSAIDDERLEATKDVEAEKISDNSPSSTLDLGVAAVHYEALGLEPNQDLTDEDIRSAYRNKILESHPDKGGDGEQARRVNAAKDALRSAYSAHVEKKANSTPGKRHFSTSHRGRADNEPELLLKQPPRSFAHPNTGHLIKLVLEEKKYETALALIKSGDLHPDGFDANENTLLTQAVENKDVKGVEFALTQAKCSVDLSCDCPLHNTAMHYWAQGAGAQGGKNRQAEEKIFNLLIQHKARINLINTKGDTPLDMTKDKTAIRMLEGERGHEAYH